MYQAITTKWLGPTNTKGSRIRARAVAASVTVHWDYALNVEMNHQRAADMLAEKLGWVGDNYAALIGGGLPDQTGYCFVFANTKPEDWRSRVEA